MNRIDRVSAILIQLQSRKVVKAQDIAERFSISLRTVYRDIKSLEEAGIPVLGEAGVGYSLMDGYRLPPVMFTREEAISFLTAEKLVEKLTDDTNARNFKSAMYKLRAVLRSTEKDLLEKIDGQIEVLKINRASKLEGNYTEQILKAIAERRAINIFYFSHYSNEWNKRVVEPIGIFHFDQHWHLIGYCTMRKDYRNFRFDRIKELAITNLSFGREHISLKEYLTTRFEDRQLHQVKITVPFTAAAYLGQQKYYMGFVSEIDKEGELEMNFLSPSLEGFARWFLTIGDYARILEPESLRVKVKELAQQISNGI